MEQKSLSNYDTILMDCDGVIFDSNSLKSQAFEDVLKYKKYPKVLIGDFISYHKNNGGVSRYKKFEVFIRSFLKQEFDKILYEELLDLYGNICLDLYKKANLTDGLINFLSCNKSTKYVVSGGKQEELRFVFKERKIDHYFDGIYGSPKTKSEIVANILSYDKLKNKNIIFIGDSREDLEVSLGHRLECIFMEKYSENKIELSNYCKKNNIFTIKTLEDLS